MGLITEHTLLALANGDSKIFKEIFNTYWEQLFTAAYRRVQDEQQAQDIVQEVFMQLWDRRQSLNLKPETLPFYLLKAVKNRVINYYYREKVKDDLLSSCTEHFAPRQIQNEEHQLLGQMELFVNEQIEGLPPTMKTIFLMRENHFPIKEIAIRLNLAEQTVKNNISEAQQRLRDAVKRKIRE